MSQSVNVDVDIDYVPYTEKTEIFLLNQLKWLNKWILYLPTWTSQSSSHKKRNGILNVTMLLFVVIATIITYSYYCYNMIKDGAQFTAIYNIFWGLMLLLTLMSRFISAYYFYFHFNWPWHFQSFQINDYDGYTKTVVERWCKFIRLMIIFIIIMDLITKCTHYYEFNKPIAYIDIIVFRIFVLYPQCILIAVQSGIFVKYYLYLSEISNNIRDNDNVRLQTIYDQYEKLYKGFNRDHSIALQTSVLLFLTAEMLYAWNNVYYGRHYISFIEICDQICGVLKVFIIFILFVSGSSLITECHKQFVDVLWSKGRDYVIAVHGYSNNKLCYLYTLQYVRQHCINVRIGKYAVTKKTSLRFLIIIIITKAIAWGISRTLEQNYGT